MGLRKVLSVLIAAAFLSTGSFAQVGARVVQRRPLRRATRTISRSTISAVTAASTTTQHEVDLTWSESTTGVTFNVYRAAASTCTGVSMINASPVTTTVYADTTVTNGGTFSYYVTAVGTGGESAPSNCVTVQIPSPPPAPTGLTATVK